MSTATNLTMKSTIAFGALVIVATVIFIGSEGNEGTLSIAANNAAEVAATKAGPGPMVRPKVEGQSTEERAQELAEDLAAERAEQQAEEETEIVWDEDGFFDDTAGFDPTPTDNGPALAGPTDNTVNASDASVGNSETAFVPVGPGVAVGIPSDANLPGT